MCVRWLHGLPKLTKSRKWLASNSPFTAAAALPALLAVRWATYDGRRTTIDIVVLLTIKQKKKLLYPTYMYYYQDYQCVIFCHFSICFLSVSKSITTVKTWCSYVNNKGAQQDTWTTCLQQAYTSSKAGLDREPWFYAYNITSEHYVVLVHSFHQPAHRTPNRTLWTLLSLKDIDTWHYKVGGWHVNSQKETTQPHFHEYCTGSQTQYMFHEVICMHINRQAYDNIRCQ